MKTQNARENILGAPIPAAAELTDKQHEKLMAGSVFAMRKFYGYASMFLDKGRVEWIPGMVDTLGAGACVELSNGRYIFRFDPHYFLGDDMSVEHFAFAVAHEATHVALQHVPLGLHYSGNSSLHLPGVPIPKSALDNLSPETAQWQIIRGTQVYLPFNQTIWMIACDRLVNTVVEASGICKAHHTWVSTDGVNLQEHSEEYQYAQIFSNAAAQGCIELGSGDGPALDAANLDESDLNPDPNKKDPFDQNEQPTVDECKKRAQSSAATIAEGQKKIGQSAGALQRYVDQLDQSKVDWRSQLITVVTSSVRGGDESSYLRPDRRVLAITGIVLPQSMNTRADTVVINIDTSGSVSKDEMRTFLSELAGAIAQFKPKTLIVLPCDCEVHPPVICEDLPMSTDFDSVCDEVVDNVAPYMYGGGGTSFTPPFDWVEQHWDSATVDLCVYFTDGYGRAPVEPPSYPVVWCSTGRTDFVSWGEMIKIGDAQ